MKDLTTETLTEIEKDLEKNSEHLTNLQNLNQNLENYEDLIFEPKDLIIYLKQNYKLLDSWSKKFMFDIDNKLKKNVYLSRKQYQVLILKVQSIYFILNHKKIIQELKNK